MHNSSMQSMSRFLEGIDKKAHLKILDIGSHLACGQVEGYGNLVCSELWEYTGLDLIPGDNVDVVAENPFEYPVKDGEFDVVISGQCIEHVSDLLRWTKELYRILKPGGYICIIGPSAGPIHNAPPAIYDYWRILPDGMKAALEYSGFIDIEISLSDNKPWQDCVGIARKS